MFLSITQLERKINVQIYLQEFSDADFLIHASPPNDVHDLLKNEAVETIFLNDHFNLVFSFYLASLKKLQILKCTISYLSYLFLISLMCNLVNPNHLLISLIIWCIFLIMYNILAGKMQHINDNLIYLLAILKVRHVC
jgi:hypothetical protein